MYFYEELRETYLKNIDKPFYKEYYVYVLKNRTNYMTYDEWMKKFHYEVWNATSH